MLQQTAERGESCYLHHSWSVAYRLKYLRLALLFTYSILYLVIRSDVSSSSSSDLFHWSRFVSAVFKRLRNFEIHYSEQLIWVSRLIKEIYITADGITKGNTTENWHKNMYLYLKRQNLCYTLFINTIIHDPPRHNRHSSHVMPITNSPWSNSIPFTRLGCHRCPFHTHLAMPDFTNCKSHIHLEIIVLSPFLFFLSHNSSIPFAHLNYCPSHIQLEVLHNTFYHFT